MDPILPTYTERLVQVNQRIIQSFSGLSSEALNWKPNASSWSIGQCLDHIMVLNRLYFPDFDAILTGEHSKPFWGKVPGLPGFLGKFLKKAVDPQNPKKMNTVSVFEPSKSQISPDILLTFATHHEELISYFQKLQPFLGKNIILRSPASPLFTYSLDDALEAIVLHEERHAQQAEQVKTTYIQFQGTQ